MRAVVAVAVVLLLWMSPARAADDPAALQAERVRLSEELEMMASRNAWRGVESSYQKLADLEKKGVILAFEDYYYGAQAARSLGSITNTYTRLKKAQALQTTDEIDNWVAEIEASYGPVDLYVDPRYKDDFSLSPSEMPFDPEQRSAIEAAKTSLTDMRAYQGILPHGAYTFGDQSFDVTTGGQLVTIELLGKGGERGEAKVTQGESDEKLTYVGPRAAVGLGVTSVGDSAADTLQPRGFNGAGARLGLGVEAGLNRHIGGFVEVGYHGTLGRPVDEKGEVLEERDEIALRPNTLHLGYGWLGGVYRINDLALQLGPTLAIGGGGITGVDGDCKKDCGGLGDADKQSMDYQRLAGSVRAAGGTMGVLYQFMAIGKLRGGLSAYGGALTDGSRLYPWGTLSYAVAPPTPRRR